MRLEVTTEIGNVIEISEMRLCTVVTATESAQDGRTEISIESAVRIVGADLGRRQ